MSKTSPTGAPKQNFLLTTLWMIAIFFTINMFFNKPAAPVVQGGAEAQLAILKSSNAKLLDVSIVSERSTYEGAIDEEVKAKKLTEEEANQKKMEAAVITADTQFKAGLARNESSRFRNAYYTLIPFHKKFGKTPLWNQTFAVTDVSSDKRFGWKEWSPDELYKKTIETLGNHNKTELIWGFIPGGYSFIDFLVNLTGANPGYSYALAALILALIVRGAIFPLAQKQFMFSRQMQQLAPLVAEIKDKYKTDKN